MIDFNTLNNTIYWNKTLDKLLNKSNISKEDKEKLKNIVSFERVDYINKILDGKYKWSIPRKVRVRKSGTNKHRIVYVYSPVDRLILGVLYHALSETYNNEISDFCYSYKSGCNTSKAIGFIKDNKPLDTVGVKLDIHAYFNSINKKTLLQMFEDLFPEDNGFKKTMISLMFTDKCNDKNIIVDEYKSIIAGTPTASFFANYCLRELDNYFQEKGIVYARYSDDIIIIDNTDEDIKKDLEVVNKKLKECGLVINKDKYEYFYPGDDITFLGLKLRADGVVDISDHSKKKIKRNIHNFIFK